MMSDLKSSPERLLTTFQGICCDLVFEVDKENVSLETLS